MYKKNYVRALIAACFWWDSFGHSDEFDQSISVFPKPKDGSVPPEMIQSLAEIKSDPGYARKCLAEIAGPNHKDSVHIHVFGHDWRNYSGVSIFASGRAERAYRRHLSQVNLT
jgi:hypothetical protein